MPKASKTYKQSEIVMSGIKRRKTLWYQVNADCSRHQTQTKQIISHTKHMDKYAILFVIGKSEYYMYDSPPGEDHRDFHLRLV